MNEVKSQGIAQGECCWASADSVRTQFPIKQVDHRNQRFIHSAQSGRHVRVDVQLLWPEALLQVRAICRTFGPRLRSERQSLDDGGQPAAVVVMIEEHMEESLVLLKNLLCWSRFELTRESKRARSDSWRSNESSNWARSTFSCTSTSWRNSSRDSASSVRGDFQRDIQQLYSDSVFTLPANQIDDDQRAEEQAVQQAISDGLEWPTARRWSGDYHLRGSSEDDQQNHKKL